MFIFSTGASMDSELLERIKKVKENLFHLRSYL
jgi:hypothetical protein